MAAKKTPSTEIDILRVNTESITFRVVGTSPFVCNAMSAKVMQDLLLPKGRKSRQEKDATLKHDPLAEFERSMYRSIGAHVPTRIVFPAAGFKRAMASAALELPGVSKAQIGRLCWVEGAMVSIYGRPLLWMAVVRSADVAKTPDVRTRAILPEWAAEITVSYVTPNLRRQPVANLMASAGVFIGVGDGRPEKGAMSFGRFKLVDAEDSEWHRIVTLGAREAQDSAIEEAEAFDMESEQLLEWWRAEKRRRGFDAA